MKHKRKKAWRGQGGIKQSGLGVKLGKKKRMGAGLGEIKGLGQCKGSKQRDGGRKNKEVGGM